MSIKFKSPIIEQPASFSPDVIHEAEQLVLRQEYLEGRDQLDLVTIDPVYALELDTGFDELQSGVAVTIPDPGLIDPSGEVLIEALARGDSRYYGDLVVPMLPDQVTTALLGFQHEKGENAHPGITVDITSESKTSQIDLSPPLLSETCILANLNYKEFMRSENDQQLLNNLRAITSTALKRDLPASWVWTNDPHIHPSNKSNGAHRIVQTAHTFYNIALTNFAQKNNIPVLFTNLIANPKSIRYKDLVQSYLKKTWDRRVRKHVSRRVKELGLESWISPNAEGHFLLARKAFAKFVGDLRSPISLVNALNISAFLRGFEPPFSKKDLGEIGEYLQDASDERKEQEKDALSLRVEAALDNQYQFIAHWKPETFRRLVHEAVFMEDPPQVVMDELMDRINLGTFAEVEDMVTLAAGPAILSPAWAEPRAALLKWLTKNSRDVLEFFHIARNDFDHWQAVDFQIELVDKSWHTWITAVIDEQVYTLPHRLSVSSANVARKHANLAFWTHYLNGELINQNEPPSDQIVEVEVNSGTPMEFPLPKEAPEVKAIDKQAANKLHRAAMVLGLGPPRFDRRKKWGSKGPQCKTQIYGMTGIDAVQGKRQVERPGKATNYASGVALTEIRNTYDVNAITATDVENARTRRWLARLKKANNGQPATGIYHRPTPRKERKFGPLADLERICNYRNLGKLTIQRSDDNTTTGILVDIDGKRLSDIATSEAGKFAADTAAAQGILHKLPSVISGSADRLALVNDKKDPMTPLGQLYALAENHSGRVELRYRNHAHYPLVHALLHIGEGKYSAHTLPTVKSFSERIMANNAATRLLEHLQSTAPELTVATIAPMPSEPTIEQSLPLGYLLCSDLRRELELVCHEQGHTKPKYEFHRNVGSKKTSSRYSIETTTADGDMIFKRCTHPRPEIALNNVTAWMLSHLRPEYRGAPIYVKKLDLLASCYPDFEVGDADICVEEEHEDGFPKLYSCTRQLSYKGRDFEITSFGRTANLANNTAAHYILRKLEKYFYFLNKKVN